MFAAYGVGYRKAERRCMGFTQHLLKEMDNDMDGEVEKWVKKRKRQIKDEAHEV